MNKKKKTTRIKHRKNQERTKKLLQASLLKAKPKKVVTIPTVEKVPEIKEDTVKISPANKPTAKKKEILFHVLLIRKEGVILQKIIPAPISSIHHLAAF